VLGFKEGYHVDTPDGGSSDYEERNGAGVEFIENKNYETGLYLSARRN
jgi:lactoylglutathione lyase